MPLGAVTAATTSDSLDTAHCKAGSRTVTGTIETASSAALAEAVQRRRLSDDTPTSRAIPFQLRPLARPRVANATASACTDDGIRRPRFLGPSAATAARSLLTCSSIATSVPFVQSTKSTTIRPYAPCGPGRAFTVITDADAPVEVKERTAAELEAVLRRLSRGTLAPQASSFGASSFGASVSVGGGGTVVAGRDRTVRGSGPRGGGPPADPAAGVRRAPSSLRGGMEPGGGRPAGPLVPLVDEAARIGRARGGVEAFLSATGASIGRLQAPHPSLGGTTALVTALAWGGLAQRRDSLSRAFDGSASPRGASPP